MIPLNITDSLVDGYHSFEGQYLSDICMSDYCCHQFQSTGKWFFVSESHLKALSLTAIAYSCRQRTACRQYMKHAEIVIRWTEGRSSGTTSVVKRSARKSGVIGVLEKVSIAWGKSKKAYNAEVLDDGSSFWVPQQASQKNCRWRGRALCFVTYRSCPSANRKIFAPEERASFDTDDGQCSGCCCRTGSQSYMPLPATYNSVGSERCGWAKVHPHVCGTYTSMCWCPDAFQPLTISSCGWLCIYTLHPGCLLTPHNLRPYWK